MTNSRLIEKQAWANYWTDARSGGSIGCLPSGNRNIDSVLDQVWEEMVTALPRKARVIDLATGDGVVLKKLRKFRSDVKLLGVDYAETLPSSPKGINLRTNVDMEALPFPDNSFEAVTSRFGIEYANVERAAAQVQRVLSARGRFCFVVHHKESAIYTENAKRVEGLEWALDTQSIGVIAQNYLKARDAMRLPVPPAFARLISEGRAEFGVQSVAVEFCSAIENTLRVGQDKPAAIGSDIIKDLERHGRAEIMRTKAMMAACKSVSDIDQMKELFEGLGLTVLPPETLKVRHGSSIIAWKFSGRA